jgi:hypothetical protein
MLSAEHCNTLRLTAKIQKRGNFLVDIQYMGFRMSSVQNVVAIPAGKYREMSVLQGRF